MAARARSLAETLDQNMYERFREIQNAAYYLQTGITDSPAQQRALLETLKNTYPYYLWIGIADRDGIVTIGTKQRLEGDDISVRNWFEQSLTVPFVGEVRNATPLEGELPEHDSSLQLVDIAIPIMNDNGTGRRRVDRPRRLDLLHRNLRSPHDHR